VYKIPCFSLKIGKYAKISPGELRFAEFGDTLAVPQTLYPDIKDALGLGRGGRVRCDIKTNIELEIFQRIFIIGPDLYVDQSTADKYGNCDTRFYSTDYKFRLPMTYLRSKCLLFNYRAGLVGFGTQINGL
jgi:hypothetical protein